MNTTIVIYHRADFDGIFCREIARKHFGETADYVGWDYGDPVPQFHSEVTKIFMLDISIESLMDDPRLIWIDHHKSAIDKYVRTPAILGVRIGGVAACRLAWQWFADPINAQLLGKGAYVERVVEEPFAVRLAGEYDIWDKRDPRAELFQHGLRSVNLDTWWPNLLTIAAGDPTEDPNVEELLEKGEVLQYAKTKENESIIRGAGFTVEFEGLTFLACNAARYNSHLFTAGIRSEHQGLLGFNYDGKKWRISLYGVPGKPDIDLSAIAVRHGGGGHKQACGFEAKTLPFQI